MRVALYARVSTSNHGQDVTLQTRELKEFIQHSGWQLNGAYVDLGLPGLASVCQSSTGLADAHRHHLMLSSSGNSIDSRDLRHTCCEC